MLSNLMMTLAWQTKCRDTGSCGGSKLNLNVCIEQTVISSRTEPIGALFACMCNAVKSNEHSKLFKYLPCDMYIRNYTITVSMVKEISIFPLGPHPAYSPLPSCQD